MPTSDERSSSTISYMAGEIQALTIITQALVVMLPDLDGFLAMYDRMTEDGLARIELSPVADDAVGAFRHRMSAMKSLAQQTLELRRKSSGG